MKKEYKDLSKAYQSIYEAVTDRPTNPTTLKPDPRSTKIAQDLFAKPSTIAPAATPTKPASTPPVAAKPATLPAASVSPNSTTTSPAAPAVPQKTFQQELDDLRKASAQATMIGPSKEAQALMSTRAKNILGPEKLKAGIEAQQRVEKMKSEIGMPKVEAPKPAAVPPPAPTLPPPPTKPETRKPTSPPPPKPSTGLTAQEKKEIDDFRKLNTLEKLSKKGEMEQKLSKLDPKKRKEVMDYYNRKESYEDLYDEVLNYLINEGCTLDESNYIMTYVVEQGMPPQEIIGRGIAQFLFGPQSKTSSTKPKPNPYRPGATIRATGPNLDKFPELQRFAGQARKVAEPVAKTAGTLAALRNITPVGIAAAVMAPRPTGDATLTAARRRGDVAPPAPKLPAPEKPKVSTRLPVKPRVLPAKSKALKSVAPEDPNLKKYDELRKTDPAAAKEFGMKIWTQKYRPVLSRPDIA